PLLNAREHLVDALRRLREVRAGAFEVRDRVRQARGLFRVAEQLADVSLTALDRLEDATERADPLLEIVVPGRLGQRFRRALEIADDALDVARDDAEAAHHLRQVVARSRPDLRTRWQRRLVRAADADGDHLVAEEPLALDRRDAVFPNAPRLLVHDGHAHVDARIVGVVAVRHLGDGADVDA